MSSRYQRGRPREQSRETLKPSFLEQLVRASCYGFLGSVINLMVNSFSLAGRFSLDAFHTLAGLKTIWSVVLTSLLDYAL